MQKLFSLLILMLISSLGFAQSSYYTLIQGGGNLGLRNPGYEGTFNGYSLHFIFGRNFDDKAYLGLGIGNETLKGDYTKSGEVANPEGRKSRYDRNLFPIFIDARLPVKDFGQASKIGFLANAGYSASIGPVYDKGFMGKAGVFYLFDSLSKTKFTVSATYAYQQLHGSFYTSNFDHQHLNVSVGIMLK